MPFNVLENVVLDLNKSSLLDVDNYSDDTDEGMGHDDVFYEDENFIPDIRLDNRYKESDIQDGNESEKFKSGSRGRI